jgi:hypothetical protein
MHDELQHLRDRVALLATAVTFLAIAVFCIAATARAPLPARRERVLVVHVNSDMADKNGGSEARDDKKEGALRAPSSDLTDTAD